MRTILGNIWLTIKIIVALLFGLFVYRCSSTMESGAPGTDAVMKAVNALPEPQPCAAKDFTVKDVRWRKEPPVPI